MTQSYGWQRPGRRVGQSARFPTYYKVQTYDDITLSWVDIQKQHETVASARAAFPAGERCRIIEVNMRGRAPVPGSERGC